MASNPMIPPEPRNLLLDPNIQGLVPQIQAEPDLPVLRGQLPNGNMSVYSSYNYATKTVNNVIIPIGSLRGLFIQKFDSSEQNFAENINYRLLIQKLNPPAQFFQVNIANFIGNTICGLEMSEPALDALLTCTRNYLEGTMEILPNGTFKVLTAEIGPDGLPFRRNGLNRRYSALCIFVHYAITAKYKQVLPGTNDTIRDLQMLMQDIYAVSKYTSVYTLVEPFIHEGARYNINLATIQGWATTIPWHALIYNSQAPLTHANFLDLFFKIYSVSKGKVLRYNAIHSNDQRTHTIVPNSPFYTKAQPTGMVSHVRNITADAPTMFIAFMRYFMASHETGLDWELNDEADDDSNDDESENDPTQSESVDESSIS